MCSLPQTERESPELEFKLKLIVHDGVKLKDM